MILPTMFLVLLKYSVNSMTGIVKLQKLLHKSLIIQMMIKAELTRQLTCKCP